MEQKNWRSRIGGDGKEGGRGYLSLTILSNIHRRLQGNTYHLYLNDVTNFLGMEGSGRRFLGKISLWTEEGLLTNFPFLAPTCTIIQS